MGALLQSGAQKAWQEEPQPRSRRSDLVRKATPTRGYGGVASLSPRAGDRGPGMPHRRKSMPSGSGGLFLILFCHQ